MFYKRTKRAFLIYFVLVLASVLAFNIAGQSSVVMYIGYIVSLLIFFSYFARYVNRIDGKILGWGAIIFVAGLISAATHSKHIFDNMRLLGLNINIFVPLFYAIIIGILHIKKMPRALIEEILESYSKICLVVIVVTLAFNFNSIGRIFSSTSNAYQVALKGFFPNKNMFGDFASMATVISIYL